MSTMTYDNSESTLTYLGDRITKHNHKEKHDNIGFCRCLGPAAIAGIGMWILIFKIFI